jgi:hypothetical protein
VLEKEKLESIIDPLPATYHYHDASGKRVVGNPVEDTAAFLRRELSLGSLGDMLSYLWLAGARRPAMPLHFHVAMNRSIVIVDRMDLHLLWTNEGRLFVKPIPRFLLDPVFCRVNLQCIDICTCDSRTDVCQKIPWKVALGFLYTYACLVSSESDFNVAQEKCLLPCRGDGEPIRWADWKTLARELLRLGEPDSNMMHARFLRAELRLSRINSINRFTRFWRFEPYLRSRHNYGSLFGDNLAWMTAATVFIALVLTAMQVGLATERLKDNAVFQQASYGFTVFAILGPLCAFGLVVVGAMFHLVKDLPLLLGGQRTRKVQHSTVSNTNSADVA